MNLMMLIIFQGDVNSVEIGRRRGSECGRTEGYRQQSPWVTNIIFKTNFLASSSLNVQLLRFKAEVGDEIMRLLTLPQPKVPFNSENLY